MIRFRDAIVAGLSITATVGAVGAWQSAPLLPATAYDWSAMQAQATAVGEVRQIVRSPTATLAELEIHITTLKPGQTSHAPHQHPNEELIIVKEGTVEALVGGEWKKLGPGSVIFQATNQLHGIRNVGEGLATYHVVNWRSNSFFLSR